MSKQLPKAERPLAEQRVTVPVTLELELLADSPAAARAEVRALFQEKPAWWIKLPGTVVKSARIRVDPRQIPEENPPQKGAK